MLQFFKDFYRNSPFLAVFGTVLTVIVALIVTVDVWRWLRTDKEDIENNQLHRAFPVDLQKYKGTWHEIGSLPAPFQDECGCTTAEYGIRDDNMISVFNRCKTLDGGEQSIRGVAWSNNNENTWLKVSFAGAILPEFARRTLEGAWPFSVAAGDYLILHVEPDYSVAMVGSPSRQAFWLLSRKKEMQQADFERYMALARSKGYNTDKVRQTCVQ